MPSCIADQNWSLAHRCAGILMNWWKKDQAQVQWDDFQWAWSILPAHNSHWAGVSLSSWQVHREKN